MTKIVVADRIAPPDAEEYTVVLDALSRAKTQLYSLRVAQALEGEPQPEGPRRVATGTLLGYLAASGTREGRKLAQDLAAAEAQVRVLEGMLEDYNAREDAWRSTQVIDAKNP